MSASAQSLETDQRKRRLAPGLNLSRIATPSNGSDSTDSAGTSRRLTRLRTTLYISIPGRHDQHRQQERENNLGQALVAHSSEHHGCLLSTSKHAACEENQHATTLTWLVSKNGRYKKKDRQTPDECSQNTDRTCPKNWKKKGVIGQSLTEIKPSDLKLNDPPANCDNTEEILRRNAQS